MIITYTLASDDFNEVDHAVTSAIQHLRKWRRDGINGKILIAFANHYAIEATVCYDTERIHLEDGDKNFCIHVRVRGNAELNYMCKTLVHFKAHEQERFESFAFCVDNAKNDFELGFAFGEYMHE